MDSPEKWRERRRKFYTGDTTTVDTSDQLHPQTVSGRALREELQEHFDAFEGGGAVESVNGQSGVVVIDGGSLSMGDGTVSDAFSDLAGQVDAATARISTLESQLADALARIEALEGSEG